MSDFGHGSVGTREQSFTTLLPLKTTPYPVSNSKFKNLGRVGCTMRRRAIKHEINQG